MSIDFLDRCSPDGIQISRHATHLSSHGGLGRPLWAMHVLPLRRRSATTLRERRAQLDAAEFDSRRYQVDVTRDVLGNMVSMVAGDVLDAAVVVLIDVVFRREKALRLCHGDVQLNVRAILAESHARAVNAVVEEPCVHDVDGLLGGLECLRHTFGRPVLAIPRGGRVGDFEEVVVEIMKVGLSEGDAEGNDRVRVSTTVKGPSVRGNMTAFVEDAR